MRLIFGMTAGCVGCCRGRLALPGAHEQTYLLVLGERSSQAAAAITMIWAEPQPVHLSALRHPSTPQLRTF